MRLHSQLVAETEESSLSVVTLAGEFLCFALEDGFRLEKVDGETRIPPGVYEIGQRREGGFYERYKKSYGHRFALHVLNVPNFEFVLIHIGNTIFDTRGCILVGFGVSYNGRFAVSQSTAAYLDLYDKVEKAFERGEKVEIEISREILQKPGKFVL